MTGRLPLPSGIKERHCFIYGEGVREYFVLESGGMMILCAFIPSWYLVEGEWECPLVSSSCAAPHLMPSYFCWSITVVLKRYCLISTIAAGHLGSCSFSTVAAEW